MNYWYYFAILFLALFTYCGYMGSQLESRKSVDEIKDDFQSKVSSLEQGLKEKYPTAPSDEIGLEVSNLANQFFKDKHQITSLVEEKRSRYASQEIQLSIKISEIYNFLYLETERVVAAYNSKLRENSESEIKLEKVYEQLPINIFKANEKVRFFVTFSSQESWGYELIPSTYPNAAIILEDSRRSVLTISLDESIVDSGINLYVPGATEQSLKEYLFVDIFEESLYSDRSGNLIVVDSAEKLKMNLKTITRKYIEWSLLKEEQVSGNEE